MKAFIFFVTVFGFVAGTLGHNSSDHHHHNDSNSTIFLTTSTCMVKSLMILNCTSLTPLDAGEPGENKTMIQNNTMNSTNLEECVYPYSTCECVFNKCQHNGKQNISLETAVEKNLFIKILEECDIIRTEEQENTNSSSTINGQFSWIAFTLSVLLFGCFNLS